MASKSVSRLKEDWMDMPVEFFEPLTFGEIEIGQKFICLPFPGDNHGHGGFKGAHYLFTKTHKNVKEVAPGLFYGHQSPHGQAVKSNGVSSNFPNSMFVVLVE